MVFQTALAEGHLPPNLAALEITRDVETVANLFRPPTMAKHQGIRRETLDDVLWILGDVGMMPHLERLTLASEWLNWRGEEVERAGEARDLRLTWMCESAFTIQHAVFLTPLASGWVGIRSRCGPGGGPTFGSECQRNAPILGLKFEWV